MSRKISKLNSDKFKCFCDRMFPLFMLLMIDGNYEIDELIEHVFYDFGYLICLRHLFLSRAATNFSPPASYARRTHARRRLTCDSNSRKPGMDTTPVRIR